MLRSKTLWNSSVTFHESINMRSATVIKSRTIIAVSLALLCALGSPLVAQTAPALPHVESADFASTPQVLPNGIRGELVTFESASPADFAPMLKSELGNPVKLTAQLFLPRDARAPVAAVIETPGSGNLGPHHLAHAATLTSEGIAVLIVDPFFGRGITDTIADQGKLTFAASVYDVLAAAKYLRTRKEIDPVRLGATGGSRGGTAVMMAIAQPISDAVLGKDKGLHAVVAGYPWCGVQFKSSRLADGASLLILSGDRDDWVSPQQCQDAAHAMDVAKQDAVMKLFPGALHAFDREGVPRTPIPTAVTSTIFPTIYMSDDGQYYNMRTGELDPTMTAASLAGYSVKGGFLHKGVTIGSEGDQAVEFSKEMADFFKAKLK
jgi:dienelactone hydrolase